MLQNTDISENNLTLEAQSDDYITMFFLFDSVLENSEIQSQTAIQLFKNIQNQGLQ